ncbi:hypothetical protein AVEN_207697-1 [Araneus ventricosus]|uniref:Uncharacterized protein n=1 Tax=Araneus ventricosus TaxID=182803 RepID=A0A4Y2J0T9_ARAVE|nr:hypothetical protein AVEN_52238-1 [Araneus ventricosus]GBM82762.1 hypothetical protein AVEN_207697-1 [Araneus ventricosus]
MTVAAIGSSTEARVPVASHLATTRTLLKEVHSITGGGTFRPTLTIPSGSEFLLTYQAAALPCTRCAPPPKDRVLE